MMKLLRFGGLDDDGPTLELDLTDCAEIAAALQESFPDLGAYESLRNAFAALESRAAAPDASIH